MSQRIRRVLYTKQSIVVCGILKWPNSSIASGRRNLAFNRVPAPRRPPRTVVSLGPCLEKTTNYTPHTKHQLEDLAVLQTKQQQFQFGNQTRQTMSYSICNTANMGKTIPNDLSQKCLSVFHRRTYKGTINKRTSDH